MQTSHLHDFSNEEYQIRVAALLALLRSLNFWISFR